MGLTYNVYLDAKRVYGCKNCKTHLADHDEIISRVCLLLSCTMRELLLTRTELPRSTRQSLSLQ